jgi:ELWxxDGT repeat protein
MTRAHAHRLEPRRLLSAISVADLSLSDIPDPAGGVRPGAVLDGVYYFPVQWQSGRPFFPPGVNPQLFRSDGTPAGTTSVQTFDFGRVLSDFTAIDGRLYLSASEGSSTQVWRSDGTPAGTVLVHEGTISSPTENGVDFLTAAPGGDVYFNADGLWRISRGAAAATRVSTEGPLAMTTSGGSVYFMTQLALWRTAGNAASTVQVKALPINYPSRPSMVTVGGVVYFRADSQGLLYRSDGTAAGTYAVTGPPPAGSPAPPPYQVSNLTLFRDQVFFSAYGDEGFTELWKSDGTAGVTTAVADIRPGPLGSNPGELTVVGDTLYFTADDGTHGRELWKTDGTAEGTSLVADLAPGRASSTPRMLTSALGKLFFTWSDPAVGQELFVTDGTEAGTRPVEDYVPGPASPLAQQITAGPSGVFFTGVDPAHGYSVFTADDRDVSFVGDILLGLLNVRTIGTLAAATDGGDVYYADGDTTPAGREPYVAPAGGGTPRPAADLEPGLGSSDPQQFNGAGDAVFFRATTGAGGVDLWRGVPGGVELLKDLIPADAQLPSLSVQGPFGGRWFINVRYTPGDVPFSLPVQELWVTQGTVETTAKLASINVGALVPWRDALYYIADGGTSTTASLVRMSLDGTTRQTIKSVPTNPPFQRVTAPARELRAVGDVLYFSAVDGLIGGELWRSDGTPAGTFMVKDLAPGATHSMPNGFTQLRGNAAVFAASPNSFEGVSSDLWVTDGTAAGTVKLLDVRPGMRGSNPRDFVRFGGAVYFTADDGAHGRELWKTDGTTGGTLLVMDVNPGPAGSAASDLKVVAGRLYFVATDPEGGREVWLSNGTPAGTERLADINPGPGSSDPLNLTDVRGELYFTANDGTRPRLYRAGPVPSQVVARHVFYNDSSFDGNSAGADLADDAAIATDKNALLAGQDRLPGFVNVTSYARGINGVMIDIARPPLVDALIGVDDFDFGAAGRPASVTVRPGGGVGGSDRITLVWRDYNPLDASPMPQAVGNGWLAVTVKANAHTGLAQPDVFSFGNLIGETGDGGGAAGWRVNALDLGAVKNALNASGGITSTTDFNRDGRTNALDLGAVKRNLNHSLSLFMSAPPAPTPALAALAAPNGSPLSGSTGAKDLRAPNPTWVSGLLE